VPASDIVVTNGALEALNLCLQAVTQPGDTVIVEAPTFYGALQALERLGVKALEVQTHPRTGIDLDAMEAAIQRHAPKACWLMTQFQNPLGSLMPDDKKRQLVELLARHDIPLIEDDVYGELYFGAARPVPAKAYDKQGLVLHCSSFSKCLAPGYRIGWASAGRYAQRVQRLKLTSTLSASGPAQGAIAEYLEQGGYDRHLRRLRETLQAQQERMADAIAREFPAGTRVTRPQGGFFLWLELPAAVDALALHRDALARGISVAPGPIFSASGQFASALRLNYGHPWDAAHDTAIRVLGELARQTCARAARSS
jgi:DNA-binding transcriptional MocR family regulator